MWLVDEAAESSLHASPPVVVSGLSVLGIGLQDWVYILTIIYLLWSIGKGIFTAVQWLRRKK